MPDRTYTVSYDCSSAVKAAQDVDTFRAAIEALETVADRVKPKLQGFANGVSTGFTNTAKASDKLKTSLDQVSAAGDKASISFRGLQSQTVGTATQIRVCGQNADHATGAFGRWASKGLHLNATLMRVAWAAAGIGGFVAIIHGITKAFQDSIKALDEYAVKVLKLREQSRETRAATGDKTDQDTVNKIMDLRMTTGMSQEGAQAFTLMWPAALAQAKKSGNWKLNEAETEKVRIESAKSAEAKGISPETMGRLVPLIGASMPVNTAADVLGQVAGVEHFSAEAVGKFTPLMKALLKEQGGMVKAEGGGAFKSFAEAMAAMSATTGAGIQEARLPAAMGAVWRELSAPKTNEERENLAKIGIVPGKTDYVTDIEKIGDYLKGTRAAGKDDKGALRELGLKADAANRSMVASVKVRQVLRTNQTEAKGWSDANRLMQENVEFRAQNADAFAEASEAAAENVQGQRMAGLLPLRKFAKAGLVRRGIEDLTMTKIVDNFDYSRAMMGREKSEDARYDTVVRAHIKQQVPDAKKRFPTLDMGWNTDAAEGKDLADIERQLTPEDQDRVSASMQKWANVAPQQPWMKARNPAAKPAAAAAPRPGVGAPAHAAAAAGPQASLDPEMLRTLQSIDRKMDSGGGGYIGSLPIDGGDSGPRRA
jgi:hypothetical protein